MKTKNSSENKKPINLIDISYVGPSPIWGKNGHYHFFHELVIVLKGPLLVNILGKTVRASYGDILFYNEGVPHKEHSYRGKRVEVICISWEEKRKINFPVLTHDTNGNITYLAKWACKQDQSSYPYKRLMQDKIFEVIRVELAKISESEKEHHLIKKIKNFMLHNFNKSLTLENLANYARIKKHYFLKKYKKLTGRTPMDDLRNIRLEIAKDMILTSTLPLKDISTKVGFNNVHLFSELFQKYFNMPPGHFQKSTSFRRNTVFL
ncbi:MAG: AraC family transcriptional regulator [Elusimicrobia bacterium]|nr:AraC family transcriptional regulator [Elusimicrobiota bacterium]